MLRGDYSWDNKCVCCVNIQGRIGVIVRLVKDLIV